MKFLREPLVHFLLLGGALFTVYARFSQSSGEEPPGKIVITPGLVENLKVGFQRSVGHAPSEKELDALIDDYVHEEIFVREAQAQGMDKNDPMVRRQLRTRIEFTYEDRASATPPTEAELTAFLQAHPDKFKRTDGSLLELASIRADVQDTWLLSRRQEALAEAYGELRAKYTVVMEEPPAVPRNTTVTPAPSSQPRK